MFGLRDFFSLQINFLILKKTKLHLYVFPDFQTMFQTTFLNLKSEEYWKLKHICCWKLIEWSSNDVKGGLCSSLNNIKCILRQKTDWNQKQKKIEVFTMYYPLQLHCLMFVGMCSHNKQRFLWNFQP